MYNNVAISAGFKEFLDWLGEDVELLGFTGFRGGLDVKSKPLDSKG